MSRRILTALTSATFALVVAGCSSGGSSGSSGAGVEESGVAQSSESVAVFNTFIAPARVAPLPTNTAENLLNNGGFENGLASWNTCVDGSVRLTPDTYEGDTALAIISPNCLFQVVDAEPGQSYALSCFVKLTQLEAWTGMGMTFSNSNYDAIATAPSATVTSTDYTRIETSGTAPADSSVVGMWIYSDHGAVVDSCVLTLEENRPASEPSADGNLLVNANFANLDSANRADSWITGCGGSVTADGTSLFLSNGACADQAFNTAAVQSLHDRVSTFSCAVTDANGFSALSVFYDNERVATTEITSANIGQRILLNVPASTPVNGFVSIYSEGVLRVENCLHIAEGVIVIDPAPLPINTTPPSTPIDIPVSTSPVGTPASTPVTTPADSLPADTSPQTARYRVTFNASWSGDTHPVMFPFSNPHFSPLTGATHNDTVQFWGPQLRATQGIQVVAETGNPTEFLNEIDAVIRNGNAENQITGGGIAQSPGSTSVEFDISSEFPLVTLVTMIAPSPDWFIGVHDLSLLESGQFVNSLIAPLVAYDAGTDSGVSYFSADLATVPAAGISRVDSDPADSSFQMGLPAAGELVFERLQ